MKNATPNNKRVLSNPYKISNYISKYIKEMTVLEHKQEQLELLITLLFDIDYKNLLDLEVKRLIQIMNRNFQKNDPKNKNKITTKFFFSKKYSEKLDKIFTTEYFTDNYTQNEILVKKSIANIFVLDIATAYFYTTKDNNNIVSGEVILPPLIYPSISHTESRKKDRGNIVKLQFNKEVPLNTIIKYLKEQLGIDRKSPKPKKSLIKGMRLLVIENYVRNNSYLYNKSKYKYKEILYANLYKNTYNETITMEDVIKTLQRVKKIQKDLT